MYTHTRTHAHGQYDTVVLQWFTQRSLLCLCSQCALAALRDVKSYLTDEGGEVAVSFPSCITSPDTPFTELLIFQNHTDMNFSHGG